MAGQLIMDRRVFIAKQKTSNCKMQTLDLSRMEHRSARFSQEVLRCVADLLFSGINLRENNNKNKC